MIELLALIFEMIAKIDLKNIDSYEIDENPVKLAKKITLTFTAKEFSEFEGAIKMFELLNTHPKFIHCFREVFGTSTEQSEIFKQFTKPISDSIFRIPTAIRQKKKSSKDGFFTKKNLLTEEFRQLVEITDVTGLELSSDSVTIPQACRLIRKYISQEDASYDILCAIIPEAENFKDIKTLKKGEIMVLAKKMVHWD